MVLRHSLLTSCVTYIYAVAATNFLLECSQPPRNISQEQCRSEDIADPSRGCYRNQNGYGTPCIELCPIGDPMSESDLNRCNDQCKGYIDGHCIARRVAVTVSPNSTTTTGGTGEEKMALPLGVLGVTVAVLICTALSLVVFRCYHHRKKLRYRSKSGAKRHCVDAESCMKAEHLEKREETVPQQARDSDSEYEQETSASLLAVAADYDGPSEKKPDSQDDGLTVDVPCGEKSQKYAMSSP